jgi:putative CocE/NonD family hydrolase
VLTYTSAPMESDFEVIGQVSADLYVKSSLEHTDFFARLCDVDSGGRSLNICDALVRLEPGTLTAEPDGTTRVVIDLWPTAYRFKAGHRIRLQVSSRAQSRLRRATGDRDQASPSRTAGLPRPGAPVGPGPASHHRRELARPRREHRAATRSFLGVCRSSEGRG